MPTAPKVIIWKPRREADGIVFDFRLITPKDHEFEASHKENFSDHPDASEDEMAVAAYSAQQAAIERRVDELDGDPTRKRIKTNKNGEPVGVEEHDDDDEPTIESLLRELDDERVAHAAELEEARTSHAAEIAERERRLSELVTAAGALRDLATQLADAVDSFADAVVAAGLPGEADDGNTSPEDSPDAR